MLDKDEQFKKVMAEGKEKLRESLKMILDDMKNSSMNLPPEEKERLQNLTLSKTDNNFSSKYPSFDDLWNRIQSIFEAARNAKDDEKKLLEVMSDFKKVIKLLTDSGIPFVNGRKLAFWSTRFARTEAENYAKNNNAVTDGIAQEYLRKIFMGWPNGRHNVFYSILDPDKSQFPEIAKMFWYAMSEAYADEIKKGDEVHVFFQDSVTVGNFFWNTELLAARERNAKVILHRYDPTKNQWDNPVSMDTKGIDIFLRRRAVHPLDLKEKTFKPDDTTTLGTQTEKVWKQEFTPPGVGEVTDWRAPKILKLSKLQQFAKKWKDYHFKLPKENRFHHEPPKLKSYENEDKIDHIKKSINYALEEFAGRMLTKDLKDTVSDEKLREAEIKRFMKDFNLIVEKVDKNGVPIFKDLSDKNLDELAQIVNQVFTNHSRYFSSEFASFLKENLQHLNKELAGKGEDILTIQENKKGKTVEYTLNWTHEAKKLEKDTGPTPT